MPELAIGCSGFSYNHWRGNFYPDHLPQKHWFAHYCSVFATVELNVTFYRLPKPETFESWQRETPPAFVFAIKGSRFITHIKRLNEPEEAVERYFDAALKLEEKLKVVLWQLPPGFSRDLQRLARFLEVLAKYPVRHTVEFRNESWLTEDVFSLCRAHNTALCMADWPPFLTQLPDTADFVYIRRHGHTGDNTGRYSSEELAGDARRLEGYLGGGRDVFIYFNNDIGGYAPQNALELREMLKASGDQAVPVR